MKKTAMLLLVLVFAVVSPAFATLYTYSGSGYTFGPPYKIIPISDGMSFVQDTRYDVDVTMKILDQLVDQFGQPYHGIFIGTSSDAYDYKIYNWQINIKSVGYGASFYGSTGLLEPFDNDILLIDASSGTWLWRFLLENTFTPSYTWDGTLLNEFMLCPYYANILGISYDLHGSISLARVPEPSSLMLLGSGLIGFAWFVVRRKKTLIR